MLHVSDWLVYIRTLLRYFSTHSRTNTTIVISAASDVFETITAWPVNCVGRGWGQRKSILETRTEAYLRCLAEISSFFSLGET